MWDESLRSLGLLSPYKRSIPRQRFFAFGQGEECAEECLVFCSKTCLFF